jgi:HK97 family phage portal protein
MGILQKIFGGKRQEKGMTFTGVQVGSPTVYMDWNKNADAFTTNDTIYSIIKLIGRKAASVPLESYTGTGEEFTKRSKRLKFKSKDRVEDETSDLYKLIERPNPSQGADAFWEGMFSFYALKGEAFIWLNRGLGTKPLEMYLIPPDNIYLVPDESDLYGIKGWVLDAGGKQISIPKEDVIHWKTFNPTFDVYTREHLRGISPLDAATRRLQQDNDGMDAAVSMFQKGGAKGVLFNKDYASMTPEQQTQLQNVLDRKINNTAVKSAVASLQGEWGYLDLGLSSVDMELLKSQALSMQRLCGVFGVPYELFQSDTTFANKEMAMRSFVLNTIKPMCDSLANELNRILVPAFSSKYYLEFDFSSVPELQDDLQKLATIYFGLFDRGAITADELREETGFDKTELPDHQQFMLTGQYTLLNDAIANPVDQPIEPNAKYNDYRD